MWQRGPRRNAPSRTIATASPVHNPTAPSGLALSGLALSDLALSGGVQSNGDHTADAAPSTIVVPGLVESVAEERTRQLQTALARLAEQVASQGQRQARLERHLADLAKVLGELGLEVDQRLALVEQVLDKMTAPTEEQGFSG